VVLVDDGSADRETARLLVGLQGEFSARGWKIIRQRNRYLGAARNAAARAARGKYVLFMDDDNVAKRHEIRIFVAAAEASGAELLTCFLDVFGGTRQPRAGSRPVRRVTFLGASLGAGLSRNSFGDANCLVRRSLFWKLGGFTEDRGVGCEDWELFARAVLSGARFQVVPQALVWYRESSNGMLKTTGELENHSRALRPYLAAVPAGLRPLVLLAKAFCREKDGEHEAWQLDSVRRVVLFGASRAAAQAVELASRCGWSAEYLVDNDERLWRSTMFGLEVRSPEALRARDFDLVLVNSVSGRSAIFRQLERLGLVHGRDFVSLFDSIRVGAIETRLIEGVRSGAA
jgi:hypothetical protein